MTGKTWAAGLLVLLGTMLSGCVTLNTDESGASLKISLSNSEHRDAPAPAAGCVACDLRVIQVSDGSAPASAGGEASSDKMADLAKALSKKLKDGMMVKGESIAVVSLRNRGGSPKGKVTADELADKVSGALIDTGWFEVRERVDLRGVVGEKDLETAGIVANANVKDRLAGVKYIVIGGVTVSEPAVAK